MARRKTTTTRFVGSVMPQGERGPTLVVPLFSVEGACRVVCAAHDGTNGTRKEREGDEGRWVTSLVRVCEGGLPSGIGLTLALVDPPADRALWRARAIALSGGYAPPVRDELEHQALAGWPGGGNDAVTIGCGRAPSLTLISSADLESRGSAGEPHRAFRRKLGLGAFERAVAPIPDGAGSVALLQADALTEHGTLDPIVRSVLAGVAPGIASAFTARFLFVRLAQERLLSTLSSRQREIVPYLVEGQSEPSIARMVGRSVHTVHDHTKRIYRRLRVRSRLELRDMWHGLREVPD
jgi:DNA-binding CsgD family transcriptional regulator